MTENKIYCGNGKMINTQYGDMFKISFSPDDIKKLVEQSEKNEKGWVNVTSKKRRELSKSGMTHYLEVDTWKPSSADNYNAPTEEVTAEDLPF